ncbi:hypothetical protein COU13_00860 [Candidatus Kaiserbacteria bacterium CG10_big_fil_rev_8_21_14_0_10_43_70]|uniref:DUF7282 domain-containing protein n=1 Tax=Candidatus Kaiserbacteria bacterium CG10_big_fil_rev_8_21_14_0_10_43_70 TaxID=1974605 RepID=A0A2H0UJ79_9BACT|nr:MAG: hypothetical protein COU13_00860 [Candidatus Kaiserbacteria bacterium CG10_big_fil_rev_8_21_14_0_10_43_70]
MTQIRYEYIIIIMQNVKTFLALVAGILIGLFICYFFWSGGDRTVNIDGEASKENSSVNIDVQKGKGDANSRVPTGEKEASFTVEMQLAGDNVTVKNLVIPEAGWVVVHEFVEDTIANALGATRVDPGEYDIVIVELLRSSIPESTYVVTLYSDNGNREFEINADTPMVDNKGKVILMEFETASGSAN